MTSLCRGFLDEPVCQFTPGDNIAATPSRHGIRVDTSGNAGSDSTFNQGLRIDYVYGSGMGSHIVETYGINNITIGRVDGASAKESSEAFRAAC